MLTIYRTLINILIVFLPFIILYRIIIGKEHKFRFVEKLGFFTKRKINGKLVWFHGSSVGEIKSVIPLIERIEKKNDVAQILVTSNTLSSSKVLENYKLKKTIHQFFPIDNSFVIKKFLNYWKPISVMLIESEIWPNVILETKKRDIPLVLINGRITEKTYKKWIKLGRFKNYIFEKFDLCLSQNNETNSYLKKLGSKNIFNKGNLKYADSKTKYKFKNKLLLNKFFKKKKKIFVCVSTHEKEEEFCAKLHLKLKKDFPTVLTVIIPRHINRSDDIIYKLRNFGLNIHKHTKKLNSKDNVDLYLVDTFGETKFFLKMSQIAFLGGSLIKHGGQNPIEAAKCNCKVFHGPYISNFTEVYNLLNRYKISTLIKNEPQALNIIKRNFKRNNNIKTNMLNINLLGKKILNENYKLIAKYL